MANGEWGMANGEWRMGGWRMVGWRMVGLGRFVLAGGGLSTEFSMKVGNFCCGANIGRILAGKEG
jgi:hypothetical protein